MEHIALHTKIYTNEYKNHIEDLLLLLLFFSAQADTSSYLRTQRAIFLLQNRLNIEKSRNFSYSFYKTNTGPRCYKLVDDIIINLFENGFLEIQDKVDIVLSKNGRKLAHKLEEFFYKDTDKQDFINLFMGEASKISTLSDRAMKLLILEPNKNIFGHIQHKIIYSLGEKMLLQSGFKGRANSGINLKNEEVATLLNLFNENISNQIDKSIDDLSNGSVQLPKYSALPKVRITKNCRESIIKEVFEHGLDEQTIGDVIGRFAANPEKYRNDLKYDLNGLSSILIGKSILTFISCDNNDHIQEGNDSKVTIAHKKMRQAFGDDAIILIAFALLN